MYTPKLDKLWKHPAIKPGMDELFRSGQHDAYSLGAYLLLQVDACQHHNASFDIPKADLEKDGGFQCNAHLLQVFRILREHVPVWEITAEGEWAVFRLVLPPETKRKPKGTKPSSDVLEALEAAYSAFPRKEGKARGMAHLLKEVRSLEQAEKVGAAIRAYANSVKDRDPQYIKNFGNWCSERLWADYTGDLVAWAKSSPQGIKLPSEAELAQYEACHPLYRQYLGKHYGPAQPVPNAEPWPNDKPHPPGGALTRVPRRLSHACFRTPAGVDLNDSTIPWHVRAPYLEPGEPFRQPTSAEHVWC